MSIEPAKTPDQPVGAAIDEFLADLTQGNRSAQPRRAYAADLARFASFYDGPTRGITADVLRAFFGTLAHLSPATRARKQAALASFLRWAYRHELIDAIPMARVERVRLDPSAPRGLKRAQVEAILRAIPPTQPRDHLLFRLLYETGLRVGEALGIYVDDLDLTRDDERASVRGKGGQRRTILLDDAGLVRELRAYLRRTRYAHGPLFRAARMGAATCCATNRSTSAGVGTARAPTWPARCINCATPTRPNWSTAASAWRLSASGSVTRTCRRRCATPSSRTRRPTARCAPGVARGATRNSEDLTTASDQSNTGGRGDCGPPGGGGRGPGGGIDVPPRAR